MRLTYQKLLKDLISVQSLAEVLGHVDTNSELSLCDVANTGFTISKLIDNAIEEVRDLMGGENDIR